MRLSTLYTAHGEEAAVVTPAGLVPVRAINAHLGCNWPLDLFALITNGLSAKLQDDALTTAAVSGALPPEAVRYAPLYRHPRKIWGIGLNYQDHAADLKAALPTEPASFMKCDNTIIGRATPSSCRRSRSALLPRANSASSSAAPVTASTRPMR